MLELLTTFLLAGHLLAMNIASAGPLLSIWLRWRHPVDPVGKRLAWWSIVGLIAGMVSGGLLFLATPGPDLNVALSRFPESAYWFALAELVFSLLCMMAMCLGWQVLNKWWLALFAVAASTNLLYHFPPLMAVIGQLAANSHWANEAVIDRPALLELMKRGEILSLTCHFVLSSFAVAGVAVLYLIGRASEQVLPIIRQAAGVALVATILQVPVGIWLLSNVSTTSRSALMGGSAWASLGLTASLVAVIFLMQRLLSVVLGDTQRSNLRHIAVLVCGIVLLMTMSLRLSRTALPIPQAATKTASSDFTGG